MKFFLSLFSLLLLFCGDMVAQEFTVIDSLRPGAYGTAAWGDYDGDGRKDLVYISQTMTEGQPDIFQVVHNSAAGFTVVPQTFTHLFLPAARWADLDNDGKDDLLVSGMTAGLFQSVFMIFKSNGDGTFTLKNDTLTGLHAGSIDVADYNSDGLKDIAVSGINDAGTAVAAVYRNEGDFLFEDILAGLAGAGGGEIKWCDYDQDGKPDIGLNGVNETASRSYIYRNEGGDSFSLISPYMKGGFGTLDWLDYDADGRMDMLVSGVDSSGQENFTRLHHNDGNGTFSLETGSNLVQFGEPVAADIADFNGDGKPDIWFGGGNDSFFNFSAMALGTGGPAYNLSEQYRVDITNCIVAAADIDNDGDPDLLLSHYILRNDGATTGIAKALLAMEVGIYPNPARERITVNLKEEVVLRIFDVSGKMILFRQLPAGVTTLNISALAAGSYQAVFTGRQGLAAKKLVIRK